MGTRRIDKEVHSLLLGRAENKAVVGSDYVVLVRQTAIRAIIEELAGAWPDVLALMTLAPRTLADKIVTVLTEIIAPWI